MCSQNTDKFLGQYELTMNAITTHSQNTNSSQTKCSQHMSNTLKYKLHRDGTCESSDLSYGTPAADAFATCGNEELNSWTNSIVQDALVLTYSSRHRRNSEHCRYISTAWNTVYTFCMHQLQGLNFRSVPKTYCKLSESWNCGRLWRWGWGSG